MKKAAAIMCAAVMLLTAACCLAAETKGNTLDYRKCPLAEKPGAGKKPRVTVRAQARYSLTDEGPDKPTWGNLDDHNSGEGYNTRRLRITYSDQVSEDCVEFAHVRRDWGQDEFTIQDAYLTYTGWDFANVTVGQMSAPFGREYLMNDTQLPLSERSLGSTFLGVGREIGVLLFDPACGDHYGWSAGIYGGEGNEEFDWHGTFETVARAEFCPTPDLNIGAAWNYNNGPRATYYQKRIKSNTDAYGLQAAYAAGSADEQTWLIDALYKRDGAQVWAGYTDLTVEAPGVTVDADNIFVCGGHFVPLNGRTDKLELVAGWETIDPNSAVDDLLDCDIYTFGLNYHEKGCKRQWRLQYVIRDEKYGSVDNNTLLLEYDHVFD